MISMIGSCIDQDVSVTHQVQLALPNQCASVRSMLVAGNYAADVFNFNPCDFYTYSENGF